MYSKKIKKLPAFLFNLYFRTLIKSFHNYQPIFYKGKIAVPGDRNCSDRWKLIEEQIKSYKIRSVVDLGCAEGYYNILAANQAGCFSLGVDADLRRLSVACGQMVEGKYNSVGFLYGKMDEKFIDSMPSFDMVIFMSIAHHFMYGQGEEFCKNFMIKLRNKVNKVMIFEMGQSNETENDWATKLPDMGSDPHKWISDFILSAGFSKVTKIGESDSYKKDQNRAIFAVEP